MMHQRIPVHLPSHVGELDTESSQESCRRIQLAGGSIQDMGDGLNDWEHHPSKSPESNLPARPHVEAANQTNVRFNVVFKSLPNCIQEVELEAPAMLPNRFRPAPSLAMRHDAPSPNALTRERGKLIVRLTRIVPARS